MPVVHLYKFIKKFQASPGQKNKFIIITNILALMINLATWIFLYFKLRQILPGKESDIIPLHYNVYLGIDLHGKWWKAFYMPAWGLIALAVNYFITMLVYHKKSLFGQMLTIASLAIQIIVFAAGIFTLLLNI